MEDSETFSFEEENNVRGKGVEKRQCLTGGG